MLLPLQVRLCFFAAIGAIFYVSSLLIHMILYVPAVLPLILHHAVLHRSLLLSVVELRVFFGP